MAEYIRDNPQFIVNGFVRSGITEALDGTTQDEDEDMTSKEVTDTSYSDLEDSEAPDFSDTDSGF